MKSVLKLFVGVAMRTIFNEQQWPPLKTSVGVGDADSGCLAVRDGLSQVGMGVPVKNGPNLIRTMFVTVKRPSFSDRSLRDGFRHATVIVNGHLNGQLARALLKVVKPFALCIRSFNEAPNGETK